MFNTYYQRLLTFVIFHNNAFYLTFIIIFGRLTYLWSEGEGQMSGHSCSSRRHDNVADSLRSPVQHSPAGCPDVTIGKNKNVAVCAVCTAYREYYDTSSNHEILRLWATRG